MFNRALALPTIALVTALTILPTLSLAQYHQAPRLPSNPTNPVNPGTHNPEPTTIVIPVSPTPTFSESMVFGPNGQITIIQQQGTDTFVITSP